MRLISYLLYGLFSAFLKKNKIRTPEVIFHIRLGAPWLSSSLILKCFCMLVFLSVIENIFLVSKETVVLRRWERSKQKFGFIKRVDKG